MVEPIQEPQEPQEPTEPQEPVQPDPEVTNRARGMGWVPQEEFRGDPDKWRPAEEYVSRADELMPIMKAQNRKYETTITNLQGDLKVQRETTEKILKMSEKVAQQAYDKAKTDLVSQQALAVKDGDMETWASLEQQKDKLEKPEEIKIPEVGAVTNESNPAFLNWHQDNDWYMNDQDMTLYANAFANANADPNLPYQSVLDNTRKAVERAFPHKFQNPKRTTAAAVDSGSQLNAIDPSKNKKNTYNDLPAEAKAQCNKLVDQKVITKEQYLKDYFEEE